MAAVRVRQRLGKYRIDRRLAEGGFATVYQAHDTIAGIPVALKLPHPGLVTKETLDTFRKEVRLTAGLDHPITFCGCLNGHGPGRAGYGLARQRTASTRVTCAGLVSSLGGDSRTAISGSGRAWKYWIDSPGWSPAQCRTRPGVHVRRGCRTAVL